MIDFSAVSYSYGAGLEERPEDEVHLGTEVSAVNPATPALDNLDLHVAPGELVAIIGSNGSGKTTLAKHINALLLPDSGTVTVLGMDTADPDKLFTIREHAGIVFQDPDSQMVTTVVADEVAFGPENLGLPREEICRRVDAALDAVHILDHKDDDPSQLSGGQRQRVAIADILAMEPDIIVFDEPAAMLDPRARRGIRRVTHELHDAGFTVVIITHSMNEAVHTDRVVVMDQGKVVAQGKPEEVFLRKDLLRQVGLDLPYSVRLAEALRERGVAVEDTIHTSQLEEALCRMLCGLNSNR